MPDLKCMSSQQIGMIATAYFAGFALNGLLSTIPDQIGRKKTILYAMLMSCFAQAVTLMIPNFTARTCMFFIMGLTQIKVGASYVWLSECVSFQYKSTTFTMINIYDSMTMAIVCIYYSQIDHSWFWLSLTMFLLSLVATVTILICPESPRWHLVNGRGEEAIEALNQIAKLNGKGDE